MSFYLELIDPTTHGQYQVLPIGRLDGEETELFRNGSVVLSRNAAQDIMRAFSTSCIAQLSVENAPEEEFR